MSTTHTPHESDGFYKVEHMRLHRTIIELLGSDAAAELGPLLDAHGFDQK